MKVLFKQPRELNGVNYPKGIHEVPDELSGHWYLLAMIQNGTAAIVEKDGKTISPPVEAPKKQEPAAPPAKNYHEHMAQWESKQDKKAGEHPPVQTPPQGESKVDGGDSTVNPPEEVQETAKERKARKQREKRAAEREAKAAQKGEAKAE